MITGFHLVQGHVKPSISFSRRLPRSRYACRPDRPWFSSTSALSMPGKYPVVLANTRPERRRPENTGGFTGDPTHISVAIDRSRRAVAGRQPNLDPFANSILMNAERSSGLFHRIAAVDLHQPVIGWRLAIIVV